MNYKIVIPSLLLMCSCTQNITNRNKTLILGEWYPLDIENLEGYNFMENNLCENKLGYFDQYFSRKNNGNWSEQAVYVYTYKIEVDTSGRRLAANEEKENWQISSDEKRIINYQGNTTFYEVCKDSLRIYDLTKRKSVNRKIKFLSKDTMLLSSNNDSTLNKFVRKNYQTDTIPLFDEIIFSLKGFSLTSSDGNRIISIKRDGEVVVFSLYGYEKFKMNEKAFENIENRFKKADIKTIIANYKRRDKRDSQFVGSSVTFVKGDKIILSFENPIKTINTKEFLWAYLSALFCLSYNQLEICKDHDLYPPHNSFPEIFFIGTEIHEKDSILELYGSERFYLRNLINKANITDTIFIPKYILKDPLSFWNDETRKIETDGRFFRYKGKGGKKVTLDIGFNFIDENNLEDKFRKNK